MLKQILRKNDELYSRRVNQRKLENRGKKVILALDIHDLAKDALLQMKKNEMLNVLYSHHISRLLEKPLPAFPSDDLKERFEKTCRKFYSCFITTAREAMWEKFNNNRCSWYYI